ncbi:ABC transporter permease [Afipia sp. DC4300-2b1]|uniref:ABC transporter permease n=1 Tax=Afipia sp. DC4300-2b1 TaxID=2804672 RepID=UPI003CE95D14
MTEISTAMAVSATLNAASTSSPDGSPVQTKPQSTIAARASQRRLALARYGGRRALQTLPTIVLIVLTTFILLRLAPGDMVQVLAGESGGGNPEYLEQLRSSFGLDQPIPVQFAKYVYQLLHLNLGYSFRFQVPVSELIGTRLIATLMLMTLGLILAVLIGVPAGIIAARSAGRLPDKIISALSLVIYATPNFLLGIALIVLFAVELRWLPISGMVDPYGVNDLAGYVWSVARHLVLPTLTLGLFYGAIYTRLTRSAMLEVGDQDFVLTARSKGLSQSRIVRRHVLRNAMLPLLTMIGMQMAGMVGGSVLIETIFAWPGIGRLAFEAVFQRDYNLLCGIVLCSSIMVVTINLLVDLLYTVLDPRVNIR